MYIYIGWYIMRISIVSISCGMLIFAWTCGGWSVCRFCFWCRLFEFGRLQPYRSPHHRFLCEGHQWYVQSLLCARGCASRHHYGVWSDIIRQNLHHVRRGERSRPHLSCYEGHYGLHTKCMSKLVSWLCRQEIVSLFFMWVTLKSTMKKFETC